MLLTVFSFYVATVILISWYRASSSCETEQSFTAKPSTAERAASSVAVPFRPNFGEHSMMKGTLLVTDNINCVGYFGNARHGLLVEYLTSYCENFRNLRVLVCLKNTRMHTRLFMRIYTYEMCVMYGRACVMYVYLAYI
jgi:hypothetical protein